MTGRLAGRRAVITGASSGIGAAIAKAFAREGAEVVISARRRDRLDALAAELAGHALVHPADVTRESDVVGLFDAACAPGPIDLLVNSAGAAIAVPTQSHTIEQWNQVIGLNLTAAFLCAREAMRRMIPQRRGRIINIGSISAIVPRPDSIAYTTSKFGLDGMTRSLALDGRAHGITASVLRPGATLSELGGMQPDSSMLGREMMDADTIAEAAVTMAALPDDANFLEATILPIAQPFLGRG